MEGSWTYPIDSPERQEAWRREVEAARQAGETVGGPSMTTQEWYKAIRPAEFAPETLVTTYPTEPMLEGMPAPTQSLSFPTRAAARVGEDSSRSFLPTRESTVPAERSFLPTRESTLPAEMSTGETPTHGEIDFFILLSALALGF